MRPSSIKYFFREGFGSLIRNRLMSVASIATVAACVFIMSFSYCIVSNLQYILRQMEDDIGIAVFLDDDISNDRIVSIGEEIKNLEHVSSYEYISPDQALEDLKQEWDAGDILDGFDRETNPLSSSFQISLDGIEYQSQVLDELNKIEGIRNIRHAQSETEILLKVNNAISVFGIAVIIILGIISVVIIMNTIKISVYSRKNEINIMKYVGATDWFIRWPFVIEGVLIGFIGSLIPMALSWPLYGRSISVIYKYLPVVQNIVQFRQSSDIFTVLMPVAIMFGVILGVTGSITSMKKHLKV